MKRGGDVAKGGLKPKYKTPAEMAEVIDRYFDECESTMGYDKTGRPFLRKPPTVTGLALALGFTSRQALLNYQNKKAFVDTVTRAKLRCEEYAERRLYDRDGQRGAEFSLRCNFRWTENNDDTSAHEALETIVKTIRAEVERGV